MEVKNIFIVFNNHDFKPIFLGSSKSKSAECIRSIFADAMSNKKDVLSKWVNEQWDNDIEVLFHELHSELTDEQVKHYEKEWRQILSGLIVGKCMKSSTEKEVKLIEGLKEIYE